MHQKHKMVVGPLAGGSKWVKKSRMYRRWRGVYTQLSSDELSLLAAVHEDRQTDRQTDRLQPALSSMLPALSYHSSYITSPHLVSSHLVSAGLNGSGQRLRRWKVTKRCMLSKCILVSFPLFFLFVRAVDYADPRLHHEYFVSNRTM